MLLILHDVRTTVHDGYLFISSGPSYGGLDLLQPQVEIHASTVRPSGQKPGAQRAVLSAAGGAQCGSWRWGRDRFTRRHVPAMPWLMRALASLARTWRGPVMGELPRGFGLLLWQSRRASVCCCCWFLVVLDQRGPCNISPRYSVQGQLLTQPGRL